MRHIPIKLILLLILAATVSTTVVDSGTAFAQSLAVGKQKYFKGDFRGAETALQKALGGAKSATDRAEILKVMGIAQYMQDKKPQAATTFKQAVQLKPGLTVNADEVLDESVINFFNQQASTVARSAPQHSSPTAGARPNAPLLAAKSAGGAGAAGPSTPPKGNRAPPTAAPMAKAAKATYLIVAANAPGAKVSIDGILAGSAGSPIETDPGSVELEVSAPGYNSKTVKTNIAENRENRVTVELVKPAPPPPKQVVKAAPAVAAAASPTQGGGAQASAAQGKKGKGSKGADLFLPDPGADDLIGAAGAKGAGAPPSGGGRDLASEFSLDQATGGYQAPPNYPPPAAAIPQAGAMPGALAQQQQVPPQVAPGYAAPAAPPGYAAPGYPQQQQGYPPGYAPTYPPQGYAYPPGYPPQYQQPAYPPVYQQQPQQLTPPGQNPGALPPPPPGPVYDPAAPAGDGPRLETKKKGPAPILLMMPLGIPQFVQGKPVRGILFGAIQIGGGVFFFLQTRDADAYVAESQTAIDTLGASNAKLPDGSVDKQNGDKKIQDFKDESQAHADGIYALGNYGLIGSAVGYLFSIIDAFGFPPSPEKVKKKKSSKYRGFGLLMPGERSPNELVGLSYSFNPALGLLPHDDYSLGSNFNDGDLNIEARRDEYIQLSLGLNRDPNNADNTPHEVTLGINWEF